jgi:hypothetical protein
MESSQTRKVSSRPVGRPAKLPKEEEHKISKLIEGISILQNEVKKKVKEETVKEKLKRKKNKKPIGRPRSSDLRSSPPHKPDIHILIMRKDLSLKHNEFIPDTNSKSNLSVITKYREYPNFSEYDEHDIVIFNDFKGDKDLPYRDLYSLTCSSLPMVLPGGKKWTPEKIYFISSGNCSDDINLWYPPDIDISDFKKRVSTITCL